MKVAISASSLSEGRIHDGIAHYTRDLSAALSEIGLQTSHYHYRGERLNSDSTLIPRTFSQAVMRSQLGMDTIPREISEQFDIFHCTDHRIPRVPKTPLVATIFDAIPMMHPEWANSKGRAIKNVLMARSGRWPDLVICASNYSAEEVCKYWKVSSDKIRVVHLAADSERFNSKVDDHIGENLKNHLPANYLLSVGTLQPRKNIKALIEAHRSMTPEFRATFPLVIVGASGWSSNEIEQVLKSDRHIVRLPRITDVELVYVYQRARALFIPSLHEGFGLPVLEGFAAGVPVFSSSLTSLPEVAGDAAHLYDPRDFDAFREALLKVDDRQYLDELITRGKIRTQQFSWTKTAKLTKAVYDELL